VERIYSNVSLQELFEICDLVQSTRYAEDEVYALLDRLGAGVVSVEKLKDEIRALAIRH
jgi:hypothetical protein